MKNDRLRLYILELLLLLFLFFALFVSNIFDKIFLAIILVIYATIVKVFIKKKNILSIYNKQVTILMIGFAVIYLITFYLLGLYFGYYEASVKISFWSLYKYIIPLILIIISSEIVRHTFLTLNNRSSKVLTFISLVLIDLIIYTSVYDITRFEDFFAVVGFILFASISCNLLYNYISVRFGYKSIIIYKMLTILYVYIIPIIPDIYIFFRSFLRMVYPYIIYLVLEYTYSRSNFAVAYKDKRKNVITTTVLGVILVTIVMLVSCKFKYGIIVIGSGSMTGTINKGDTIIYESYDEQLIKDGDVIIFNKNDIEIIHRVIEIRNVNGEYRYFTKGDANEQKDEGYITRNNIVGVSKLKISYIGYPTIWIRDIFS